MSLSMAMTAMMIIMIPQLWLLSGERQDLGTTTQPHQPLPHPEARFRVQGFRPKP